MAPTSDEVDSDPMNAPMRSTHLAAWKLAYLYSKTMPEFRTAESDEYFRIFKHSQTLPHARTLESEKYVQLFKAYESCGNPFVEEPKNLADFDRQILTPLLQGLAAYFVERRNQFDLDYSKEIDFKGILHGQPRIVAENGNTCDPASYRAMVIPDSTKTDPIEALIEERSQKLSRPYFEQLDHLDRHYVTLSEVTLWLRWTGSLQDQRKVFALYYDKQGASTASARPTLALPRAFAEQIQQGTSRHRKNWAAKLRQAQSMLPSISDDRLLQLLDEESRFEICRKEFLPVGVTEVGSRDSMLCLAPNQDEEFISPQTATLVSLYAPKETSFGVQLDAMRKFGLGALLDTFLAVNDRLGSQALPLPNTCLVAPDIKPYVRRYQKMSGGREARVWLGQLSRGTGELEAAYRDGVEPVPVPQAADLYARGQALATELFHRAAMRATVRPVSADPSQVPISEGEKRLVESMQAYSYRDYIHEALAETPWKNTYALRLAEKLRVWTLKTRENLEKVDSADARNQMVRDELKSEVVRDALIESLRDYTLSVWAQSKGDKEANPAPILEVWDEGFASRWEEALSKGKLAADVEELAEKMYAALMRRPELAQGFDSQKIEKAERAKYVTQVAADARAAVQAKDTARYLEELAKWQGSLSSFLPGKGTYDAAVAAGRVRRIFGADKSMHLYMRSEDGELIDAKISQFDPASPVTQDYVHFRTALTASIDGQHQKLVERLTAKGYTDVRVQTLTGGKLKNTAALARVIEDKFARMLPAEAGSDWYKVARNRRESLIPFQRALLDSSLRPTYNEARSRFVEYLYRSYFESILQAFEPKAEDGWRKKVAARVALVKDAELFINDPDPKAVGDVLIRFRPQILAERALSSGSRLGQLREFIEETKRRGIVADIATWTRTNRDNPALVKEWVGKLHSFFHPREIKKTYMSRFLYFTQVRAFEFLTALSHQEFPEKIPEVLMPMLRRQERQLAEAWLGYSTSDDVKELRPEFDALWNGLAARANKVKDINAMLYAERLGFLKLAEQKFPIWQSRIEERFDRLHTAVANQKVPALVSAYQDAVVLALGGRVVSVASGVGRLPIPNIGESTGELQLNRQALTYPKNWARDEFFTALSAVLIPSFDVFRFEIDKRIGAFLNSPGGSSKYELKRIDDSIDGLQQSLAQIENERQTRLNEGSGWRAARAGREGFWTALTFGNSTWEKETAKQVAKLNGHLETLRLQRAQAEQNWRFEGQLQRILRNYFLSPDFNGEVPKVSPVITQAANWAQDEGKYEQIYRDFVDHFFVDTRRDPNGGVMAFSPAEVFAALNGVVGNTRRLASFTPNQALSFVRSLERVLQQANGPSAELAKARFEKLEQNQRSEVIEGIRRQLAILQGGRTANWIARVLEAEGIRKQGPPSTWDAYLSSMNTEVAALKAELTRSIEQKEKVGAGVAERYWELAVKALAVFLDGDGVFAPWVTAEGEVIGIDVLPSAEVAGDGNMDLDVDEIFQTSETDLTQTLVDFVRKGELDPEAFKVVFGREMPQDLAAKLSVINSLEVPERAIAFTNLKNLIVARIGGKAPTVNALFAEAPSLDSSTWARRMTSLVSAWDQIQEVSKLGVNPSQHPLYELVARSGIRLFLRHTDFHFDGRNIVRNRETETDQSWQSSLSRIDKASGKQRVQLLGEAMEQVVAACRYQVRGGENKQRAEVADESRLRTIIGLEARNGSSTEFDAALALTSLYLEKTKGERSPEDEREVIFLVDHFVNDTGKAEEVDAWRRSVRGFGFAIPEVETDRFTINTAVGATGQRERFEAWWDQTQTAMDLEKAYAEYRDSSSLDAKRHERFFKTFPTIEDFANSELFSQVKAMLTLLDQNGAKASISSQGKPVFEPETFPYFAIHLAVNEAAGLAMPFGPTLEPGIPGDRQLSYLMKELTDLMGIDARDFDSWKKVLTDEEVVSNAALAKLAESKFSKHQLVGALQTNVPNVMVQNPAWGGATYGLRPRTIVDSANEPWSSGKSPERTLTSAMPIEEWLGRVESSSFNQLNRATATDAQERPLYRAVVAAEIEPASLARLSQSNTTLRDQFFKARQDWKNVRFGAEFKDVSEYLSLAERMGVAVDPSELQTILETRDAVVHFGEMMSESVPQYSNQPLDLIPTQNGSDIVQGALASDFFADYQKALRQLSAQLHSDLPVPDLARVSSLKWANSVLHGSVLDRRRVGAELATRIAEEIGNHKLYRGLTEEQARKRQDVLALADEVLKQRAQSQMAELAELRIARNTSEALTQYCSLQAQELEKVKTQAELDEKREFLLRGLKMPFSDGLLEAFERYLFVPTRAGKPAVTSVVPLLRYEAQQDRWWNQTLQEFGFYTQAVGGLLLAGVLAQRLNPTMSGWAMRSAITRTGMQVAGLALTGLFFGTEGLQIANDYWWAPAELESLERLRDTKVLPPTGNKVSSFEFMKRDTALGVGAQAEALEEIRRGKLRWGGHIFSAMILLPMVKPVIRTSKGFFWAKASKKFPDWARKVRYGKALEAMQFKPSKDVFQAVEDLAPQQIGAARTQGVRDITGAERVGNDLVRLNAEAARTLRSDAQVQLEQLSAQLDLEVESGFANRSTRTIPYSKVFTGVPGARWIPSVRNSVGPSIHLADQRRGGEETLKFLRKMIAQLGEANPTVRASEVLRLVGSDANPAARHMPVLLEIFGISNLSRRLTETFAPNGAQLKMLRKLAELNRAQMELSAVNSAAMLQNVVSLNALEKRTVTRAELVLPQGAELGEIPKDVRSLLTSAKREAEGLARENALKLAGGDLYDKQYWLKVIDDTRSLLKSVQGETGFNLSAEETLFVEKYSQRFASLANKHPEIKKYTQDWMINEGLELPEETRARLKQLNEVFHWWLRNRQVVEEFAVLHNSESLEDVLRAMLDPKHFQYDHFTRLIGASRELVGTTAGGEAQVVLEDAEIPNVANAAARLRSLFAEGQWVVDRKFLSAVASGNPSAIGNSLIPIVLLEDAETGVLTGRLEHPEAPSAKTGPKKNPIKPAEVKASDNRIRLIEDEVRSTHVSLETDVRMLSRLGKVEEAAALEAELALSKKQLEEAHALKTIEEQWQAINRLKETSAKLLRDTKRSLASHSVSGELATINTVRPDQAAQRYQSIEKQLTEWMELSGRKPTAQITGELENLKTLFQRSVEAQQLRDTALETKLLKEANKKLEQIEKMLPKLASEPPPGGWNRRSNEHLRELVARSKYEFELAYGRTITHDPGHQLVNPSAVRGSLAKEADLEMKRAASDFAAEFSGLVDLHRVYKTEIESMAATPAIGQKHHANLDRLFPSTAQVRAQWELSVRYASLLEDETLKKWVSEQGSSLNDLEKALRNAAEVVDRRVAQDAKLSGADLAEELLAENKAAHDLTARYYASLAELHPRLIQSAKINPWNEEALASVRKSVESASKQLDEAVQTAHSLHRNSPEFDRVVKTIGKRIHGARYRLDAAVGAKDYPGEFMSSLELEGSARAHASDLRGPGWQAPTGARRAFVDVPPPTSPEIAVTTPKPAPPAEVSPEISSVAEVPFNEPTPPNSEEFELLKNAGLNAAEGAPSEIQAVLKDMPNEGSSEALSRLAQISFADPVLALEQERIERTTYALQRAIRIVHADPALSTDLVTSMMRRWIDRPQIPYVMTLGEARVRLGLPIRGMVTPEELTQAVEMAKEANGAAMWILRAEDLVRHLATVGNRGPVTISDVLAAAEMPIEFLSPKIANGLTRSAANADQLRAAKMIEQLAGQHLQAGTQEGRMAAVGLPNSATAEDFHQRVESLRKSIEKTLADGNLPVPATKALEQMQSRLQLLGR